MRIRLLLITTLFLAGMTVWGNQLLIAEVLETPVVLRSGSLLLKFDYRSNRLEIGAEGDSNPLVLEGVSPNILPDSLRKTGEDTVDFQLANPKGEPVQVQINSGSDGAFEFALTGNGRMESDYKFPSRILAYKNESWVLPENEGLLIPATDPYYAYPGWNFGYSKPFYNGHGGFSMPFIGITNGEAGYILIVETPDDCLAGYQKPTGKKTSTWSLVWQPSQGKWRYSRKFYIKYIPKGGYVGIAKAYRKYAASKGLLVTLKEKAKVNPNVDKLIGAVDLWFWKEKTADIWWQEPDCRDVAAEIKAAGIERVLWANEASGESVATMNSLGFLTGRYDIYQDVYRPDTPADWVNKEGWPDALVLKSNGAILSGWVSRIQGQDYTGGVICSIPALDMAHRHIPVDLENHPYGARFIDTSTASPLRECYNPKHPTTRTDDRTYKSKLFDYLSGDIRLVTGSETGIDWAVPFLHYFEGMMSIANFRLADSGYDLISAKTPGPDYRRFQVGPYYRIPLFELVYHDCVVSYWYWGDSSNRLKKYWDTRDLFNTLYGTGPLWIMDYNRWKSDKERFIRSYQTATTVARSTGYSEMLDHRFLTEDHTVQYTEFSNGVKVWVNFGKQSYIIDKDRVVKANSFFINE